ncbi:WD40/YVTN repeat-like-containing domain [Plasmopara halstedii]|uniref:WD40/YVTN repeat-like-containing domain n=1 Tax=Plasmopara halstedii TaxID=4781 RepID=A0A0P1A949_PLAHL|nr:WD40/YVTN repeat-like-containing domain [Plasmopara halstedii]CEG36591.1 WD40/YVTN repeat-like-containing domain [Plasmopara halstedii]|eukprot:XP_024572960.1 WD40/YVTN repeat-like-containing domain [Plasmopara halstedii]
MRMLPWLLVRLVIVCSIVAIILLLVSQKQELTPPQHSREEAKGIDTKSRQALPHPTVQVLGKFPHDAKAFTQGFTIAKHGQDSYFLESTGLYGESTLRFVEIETGKVLKQHKLSNEHFGEGLTLGPNDKVVMLTWKSKTGFVFDLDAKGRNFALQGEFKFKTVTGEGWGITFDGNNYAVSDGSSIISFWDPTTMTETRHIDVMTGLGTQKVLYINELEYAKGFIYANVWYQPYILKINPDTGAVVTIFDLSDIIIDAGVDVNSGAVLNGIAYDKVQDVFYITGKLWNAVYKIHLIDSVD